MPSKTASSPIDREARGRAYREDCKRSSHRHIGELRRDIVDLLKRDSAGRVERLVPLRYGRMTASPFTFFRGSAILQAHDLGCVDHTSLVTPICGDGHLMNFGGFATPERQLVFDLNDFDETASAPFEWDLKRLTASIVVAARHLRLGSAVAEQLVSTCVNEYRDRMAHYAQCGALDLWYERITFDLMAESALSPERRRAVRRSMERAATRTHESMLDKMAVQTGGQWTIRDAPPSLFHVHGSNSLFSPQDDWFRMGDWHKLIEPMCKDYMQTLSHDRRELMHQFTAQDLVFKVVGVGSVGTRCLVLLNIDHMGKPLFLQIKEARRSVISQYFKASGPKHEGERVVRGQRLLQAASDIFLGWASGPGGSDFYFRQLRDMKLSANLEMFDTELFDGYARLCGWAMARAHAKASGQAIEIAAYIGRNDQFAESMRQYAAAYADQVERDYDTFMKACRSGEIEARTDEDMAADFRI